MRTDAYSSFDEVKSRVLQETDIVALVSQSVRLKRRGKDFVGLCPFHQEKTPSFSVSPSKQRFYCYGCEKGGNAIDFVMLRDRVEFKDGIEIAGRRRRESSCRNDRKMPEDRPPPASDRRCTTPSRQPPCSLKSCSPIRSTARSRAITSRSADLVLNRSNCFRVGGVAAIAGTRC